MTSGMVTMRMRYVVFSDIGGKGRWRIYLDVSSDGYGLSIDQATLFKREHVARSVYRAYSHKEAETTPSLPKSRPRTAREKC